MWKTEGKVRKFVEKYKMISPGDRVVAGISGGADSVCLLYLLKDLQKSLDFSLLAVHVNHQLREGEAERDEAFVRELCAREKIPFYGISVDVGRAAREEGISLEEAGRNVRYESFSQVCRKENGNKIALAHHQDDLAETMIHHLARGTGAAGLCSLKPLSGCRIRPLLCLTRQEVEAYLKERKIPWQTDSTNLEDHYTRNKIRHHVIEYLNQEINPRTVEHMAQTAQELGELEEFLEQVLEEKKGAYCVKREKGYFLRESLGRENSFLGGKLILGILKEISGQSRDFTREHVEKVQELLKKQVGKQVSLPYGLYARRDYEGITIFSEAKEFCDKKEQKSQEIVLQIPGRTPVGGYLVQCEVIEREKAPDKFSRIEEKAYTKWLDYDRIENSLVFRCRRPGDRFSAHPSGGGKKLKNYLIDRKIPQKEREYLLLLADGQEILWIVGDRISQKYKVSEDTRRILHIQIKGGNIHE